MKNWNSQRLREALEKSGLRRDFVANKTGIKQVSLRNVLNGTKPSGRLLSSLSSLLGTNAAYLNFQIDDPRPEKDQVA